MTTLRKGKENDQAIIRPGLVRGSLRLLPKRYRLRNLPIRGGKKVNSLVREALEIAISNWEYDGEYDKVSEAVTLIKEAQDNE